MAGVPVYAERGPRGGWHLPLDYRSGPRGLDADELRALFLSAPGTVLGDLGLDRASESALTKLLLAVPAASRREVTEARQKIIIDLSTWRASEAEPTPCLPVLHDALSRDRQVQISYLRADGARVQRSISPLGLVAKGRTWYLVGAGDDAQPRTYRVSRVASAIVSETATQVPCGFDLAAFWDASKARLVAGVPRFHVHLRAESSVVRELERAGRWSRLVAVGKPDDRDWVDVQLEFELEDDACGLALSLGSHVELVSPSELRARVASELAGALRRYAPPEATSDSVCVIPTVLV